MTRCAPEGAPQTAGAARVSEHNGTSAHFTVGQAYEAVTSDLTGALEEEHFRFFAAGRVVAEMARDAAGTDSLTYMHTDALGSLDAISDTSGAHVRQGWEAFGMRDTARSDPPAPGLGTRLGFTGHTDDEDTGLTNMKGRLFEPLTGRFMTADPVVQAPFWSQGPNQYSYVFSDPANLVDPSGFATYNAWYAEPGIGMAAWSSMMMAATSSGGVLGLAGGVAGSAGGMGIAGLLTPTPGTRSISTVTPSTAPKGTGQAPGGGSAVQQNGGAVGGATRTVDANGYSEAWRAAHAALSSVVGDSVRENTEYGGLVYKTGGRYYATAAVRGGTTSVDVWDSLDMVPEGAVIVGDYHTHSAFVTGLDPAEWFRGNGDIFSGDMIRYSAFGNSTPQSMLQGTDIFEARSDLLTRSGLDRREFTSYVSTPSGRFGTHLVRTGAVHYWSPHSSLLPPGSAVPAASYAH